MSTPKPEDIQFVPGRLAIGPTDLSAAWPHGGTGLGLVEAIALDITEDLAPIEAQEWGTISNQAESREEWLLAFSARGKDEDLLGAVFRDSDADAVTGLRSVQWDPRRSSGGTPGRLRSAEAVVLLFSPDSRRHQRSILIRCALPNLATGRALLDLDMAAELRIPLVFRAVPHSGSGAPVEWAHYRGMTL